MASGSEPAKKSVRKRRRKPSLRTALEQARKAGKAVRSAVVENDRIRLEFGEPTTDTSNEWDEALSRGKH